MVILGGEHIEFASSYLTLANSAYAIFSLFCEKEMRYGLAMLMFPDIKQRLRQQNKSKGFWDIKKNSMMLMRLKTIAYSP